MSSLESVGAAAGIMDANVTLSFTHGGCQCLVLDAGSASSLDAGSVSMFVGGHSWVCRRGGAPQCPHESQARP